MSSPKPGGGGAPRGTVLVVIGTLRRGGTETHLSLVLPALAKRGFDLALHCCDDLGDLEPGFRSGGVRLFPPASIMRMLGGGLISRALKLTSKALWFSVILLQHRPSIVHFFLPSPYLSCAPIARLFCVPYRIMSRRSRPTYRSKGALRGAYERWLHNSLHCAAANSRIVAEDLADEGIPRDRIRLIYNGVNAPPRIGPDRRQSYRRKFGLGLNQVAIVIVANLIPYKGHMDLLAALSALKPEPASEPESGPRWKLLVAGRDDGIGAELHACATRSGLDANVAFLGARTDVADLLAASDIGVLSSHEEGFSNFVLEGMAAGLPMIVTDVGGNAEAVRDGIDGLVVRPKAPEDLSRAIECLLGDAALRRRMGDCAYRRVANAYSLEACVDAYERLYDAGMNATGGRQK